MGDPRENGLFSAVVAVAAGLELGSTLRRIVQAAVDLVDASYGALGVLGPDGELSEFVHVGIDPGSQEAIGQLPHGLGILGLLRHHPAALRLEDLTTHPAAVGFPPGHPAMTSFLGVPVRVRGQVFGNLYLTDKRGAEGFSTADERIVTALAAAAGVAIDNARLYERSLLREKLQTTVAEMHAAVLEGADAGEVLTIVASRAMELTACRSAIVALPSSLGVLRVEIVLTDPNPRPLPRWRVQAPDSDEPGLAVLDRWRGVPVSPYGPIAQCFASGRAEAGSEPIIQDGDPAKVDLLALPLSTPDEVLGVLALANDAGEPLSDMDRQLAETVAAQGALVLMLERGRRENQRLALLEERDRIARDLHDLVIQRLFATGISLQGASRVPGTPPAVVDRLEAAVDALDTTVREIRATIFELHRPVGGSEGGLRARVLEETSAATVVLSRAPTTRFSGTVDASIDDTLANDLLGALREALANAAKHAHADRVEVLVAIEDDAVLLQVTDDGVGVPSRIGRRSGLQNMEERASRYGGSCTILARPQGGSVLSWRVPLT